ncbi:MAG: PIN domain-containing protein [Anaerolineae bacterium]
MPILVDTNALIAYLYDKDVNHKAAVAQMESLSQEQLVIPAPVLVELFYLLAIRISYKRAVEADRLLRQGFSVIPIDTDVMKRMSVIMTQYVSAEFDYTDAAIMALAERLNIRRIFTFDRRDFSIFRPTHVDFRELIP